MLSLLFFFLQATSSIDPPKGQKLVVTATARGVQVYNCEQGADGTFLWRFDRPEAELFDDRGQRAGNHKVGPKWEWYDGSAVIGKVEAKQDSPDKDSIQWLLLSADSHPGVGYGILGHVEYIQRVDTKGGVAPAGGCDASHLNTKNRVPYTATYKFYKPE